MSWGVPDVLRAGRTDHGGHSDRRTAITDSRAPQPGNVVANPQVGVLFIDVVSARPSRRRVNGLRRRMRLTTTSCPVEIQVSPHHSGWLGMVTVQP
jgi:hypothetical protein